jgi:hypothetical protein
MAARVTKQQVEALIAEIDVYLDAVALFRAEGCEPRWRGDSVPEATIVRRGAGRRGRPAPRRS